MCSYEQKDDLYEIFSHFGGIFNIGPKVKIMDSASLNYILSPGVSETCKKIQHDPKMVEILTNRGNQVLVVSDGTGFAEYDSSEWTNQIPIPYLEVITTHYKTQCDIDAYPLIIDPHVAITDDEMIEVLGKLAANCSAIELYRMETNRSYLIRDKVAEQMKKGMFPKIAILTSDANQSLEDNFKDLNLHQQLHMDTLIVKAAIFKACLASGYAGIISIVAIDKCLVKLMQAANGTDNDYLENLLLCLDTAAHYFIELVKIDKNQCAKPGELNKDNIVQSVYDFKLYGSKSLIKYPKDYSILKNSISENAIELHELFKGVIESQPALMLQHMNKQIFSEQQLAYIQCLMLANPNLSHQITTKKNLAAIISNGTSVLGLGDIGAQASIPVMEGKAIIFKKLGGVNMMPIVLQEKDSKKFIWLVRAIAPIFSAVTLESIKAPECFEIQKGLAKKLNFPVFNDNAQGTAIVVSAAVLNALSLTKQHHNVKVVINGAGVAGLAIAELLCELGFNNMIVCDTAGAIYKGRTNNMNKAKQRISKKTNNSSIKGLLQDVIVKADLFIGVSVAGVLTEDMVKSMNNKPIIFALANPIPEILPEKAKLAGAAIYGSGRPEYENQINNALAFPGIFRGLLDSQAYRFTKEMQVFAAKVIASMIPTEELRADYIIPSVFDKNIALAVSKSFTEQAIKQGVFRHKIKPDSVVESLRQYQLIGKLKY